MNDLFDNFQQKIVGMMNKFTEKLSGRHENAELEIEALKIQNTEQAEKFLHLRKRCSVGKKSQGNVFDYVVNEFLVPN